MQISKDKKFTHIETEKPDEIGVWELISTEGGRDEHGELKIKKVIRDTAKNRTTPSPEEIKQDSNLF